MPKKEKDMPKPTKKPDTTVTSGTPVNTNYGYADISGVRMTFLAFPKAPSVALVKTPTTHFDKVVVKHGDAWQLMPEQAGTYQQYPVLFVHDSVGQKVITHCASQPGLAGTVFL